MHRLLLLLLPVMYAISASATVIAPEKPRIGEPIRLTYTATDGPYVDSASLSAQILIFRAHKPPQLLEPTLHRDGKAWQGTFTLETPEATFLIVRFVTSGPVDDNSGKYWTAFVHGSDGKPVQDAHLNRAGWLNGQMPVFKVQRDPAAAKQELAKELEAYPKNMPAWAMRWNMMQRESPGDETTASIRRELEQAFTSGVPDQELANLFIYWFEQTGQQTRADSLRTAAITADPKGKVAENARLKEIYTTRDAARAAGMLEQFLAEFPQSPEQRSGLHTRLASLYRSSNQLDKAIDLLNREHSIDPGFYNDIAWGMVERGERLEDALKISAIGVELLRHPDPSTKASYVSQRQWEDQNRSALGAVLDTYGFALEKLQRMPEAAKAYAEAYTLTGGTDAEMNDRYVRSLTATGAAKNALEVAETSVKTGKSNDSLVAAYRSAYVAVKGSAQGFDDALAKARGEAALAQKNELKTGMLSTPAPEFALKTPDGKTVALKDLRGKVVLIDYWATWCGPCKMSFPFLQKAYEKYRKDPRVAIFAVNTWEREKGATREATVKKFLADNKYTFPVLYDDSSVEKYGVEGIPTKFMIDQKGIIRFKGVGFDGGEKMLAEIDAQLGMLLDGPGAK
jgi:thiol-disulfide isomerase/thioredoxin